MQAPPVWNSPAPGAPPAAQATPIAKRCESMGNVALGLGVFEAFYCLYQLVGPLFTGAVIDMQKSMMPSVPGGPPMDKMMDAARAMAAKIMPWNMARTVPFLIATVVLIWLATRLRRGDLGALAAARTWSLSALGVVAFSTALQAFVILPATMEYQRQVMKLMPKVPAGSSAPPIDMEGMMSSVTMISSIIALFAGIAFMSIWPIVLYVWAGRVQKAASAPAAG